MDFLTVNNQSPVPLYTQIADQIQMMAADGDLKPGDALPPIRLVAKQLGIANNTVARAYRDLESSGVIESNGRKGSFIHRDYKSGMNPFTAPVKNLLDDNKSEEQIRDLFEKALSLLKKGEQ